MKRFTFPIAITGNGNTAEEAWVDAVEGFYLDPGTFEHFIEEEEDDENITDVSKGKHPV